MATILDTLKKGAEYLQRHGVDEARLNMEHLLAHVLKTDRMGIYVAFDRPLAEAQLAPLRELTRRRAQGTPLQHLLGTIEFCDLAFKTDARALVPRPETEELASILLARDWPEGLRLLDMGCGSGVLGLTLARRLAGKQPQTTLADLSPEALALARENAAALLPGDTSVKFSQGDLFEGLAEESYDLVVANLPYIPSGEETLLSREVRRDPALSLYGGPGGTEILERFLSELPGHLRPGGFVAMEFGIGQAQTLRQAAAAAGLDEVEIRRDLSGTERFLFAVKAR